MKKVYPTYEVLNKEEIFKCSNSIIDEAERYRYLSEVFAKIESLFDIDYMDKNMNKHYNKRMDIFQKYFEVLLFHRELLSEMNHLERILKISKTSPRDNDNISQLLKSEQIVKIYLKSKNITIAKLQKLNISKISKKIEEQYQQYQHTTYRQILMKIKG